MLKPDYTAAFQRDIKKLKRKHTDLRPLKEVIRLVLEDTADSKEVLRRRHRAHTLTGDLNGVLETFDETPEYRWLQRHAHEYGFVLRYPEDKSEITGIRFEPWHYRYVGREHAEKMRMLNFCLEEYVAYLDARDSGR